MANRIIIVLGQYLADDGTLSLQCRERCLHAYSLYQKGDMFLLSGGTVNKKAGISEAMAMKNYLVELGADLECFILENNSQNTYENAKFCSAILKKIQYEKLILVSSSYHIYRWYFNPVRFFKWFFRLKVSPECAMDSLIATVNPFDSNKPSVFVWLENDKLLKEFVENSADKNIFIKTANSAIKKGLFMKKIKTQDIDTLAAHIKNLYQLDQIEVVRL